MTQLDAFIYFLERMDLEMLDEILTEDISYCGTTKKIFLEKLAGIFKYNTSLNNKTLAVKKSKKNQNCIKFVCWNNTYWENRLLVTESKGSIISFVSKRKNNLHSKSHFRIYKDEKIGFVKSADFIILQNNCKNAINLFSGRILTTEFIHNWVSVFRCLYKEINEESIIKNIRYFEEFVEFWEATCYEEELIQKYTLAEEALNEYRTTDELEWIKRYAYIFYCELIPGNTCAEYLCDETYRFKEGNIIYESKELYLVYKFTDLYNSLPRCF
ncbi:hypothetical protein [Flavobacterium nackdongense]|uniref:Uncharacterized protein n=1 Tax=Flavobacterium nackdongense TaxID=2547394 RepID=A0A4P6YC01_9FLAO|nr:hypothetical protein [Flavobacterium nackdongense]QBN19758.1 hypothetical protein E1750_13410 [Flavobacterium nackdongense]